MPCPFDPVLQYTTDAQGNCYSSIINQTFTIAQANAKLQNQAAAMAADSQRVFHDRLPYFIASGAVLLLAPEWWKLAALPVAIYALFIDSGGL